MPVYDCRREGAEAGSLRFPVPVVVRDPATGARIPNVFYLSTSPAKLGRFLVDAAGQPLVNPLTRRKRLVGGAGRVVRCVVEYDRLEAWEFRPWVATAAGTGEVVAKSEGAA